MAKWSAYIGISHAHSDAPWARSDPISLRVAATSPWVCAVPAAQPRASLTLCAF